MQVSQEGWARAKLVRALVGVTCGCCWRSEHARRLYAGLNLGPAGTAGGLLSVINTVNARNQHAACTQWLKFAAAVLPVLPSAIFTLLSGTRLNVVDEVALRPMQVGGAGQQDIGQEAVEAGAMQQLVRHCEVDGTAGAGAQCEAWGRSGGAGRGGVGWPSG